MFCLWGMSAHYWVWCQGTIAEEWSELPSENFYRQSERGRLPLTFGSVANHFPLVPEVAFSQTQAKLCEDAGSWIFRQLNVKRKAFCLWDEEIEDWKIIAGVPQEIPGTCSCCAGLEVAGWWQQVGRWNGKKNKNKKKLTKKKPWASFPQETKVESCFAGKETSQQKITVNWKTSYF